jgi:hypothetical protein
MKNIDTCSAYRYEEHPHRPVAMQKKTTSRFAFFNLRALIGLLLCTATAYFIPTPIRSGLAFLHPQASANSSQRTLSFEERVSYQRAIEDLYWRHRIWPKENSNPKPSLDAVMSQAQIEKKVKDYLRKSQALEDYWQRPITPEQLQAEMDRMAKQTRHPEVLQELFEALGNDPFVIAECLARPALAACLFHAAQHSQDANGGPNHVIDSHNSNGTQFSGFTLPVVAITSNTEGTCIDDTWTATSLIGAPTQRRGHSAVWTGSAMIFWGGAFINFTNTGGIYDPSTDTWTETTTTDAPEGRGGHTTVWTGAEMIVWGG